MTHEDPDGYRRIHRGRRVVSDLLLIQTALLDHNAPLRKRAAQ
jgi:hypothetical protein